MHRLLAMLESAWNTTEPVQPMAHVSDDAKAEMHHDHEEMLAAFLARDVDRLVAAARTHHDRLRASLAALPRHTGLFVDSD
jgi:DNA-binding GntR family transcriptional regulator